MSLDPVINPSPSPTWRPAHPGDIAACRNCGAVELEPALDLGLQPWGNHFVPRDSGITVPRYPLQLLFCRRCAMVQLGCTVPKETMFVDHQYLSGTTRSLRTHFAQVRDGIVNRVEAAGGFGDGDYVLDIGGNDGTFLSLFQERGIPVLNVDSGRKQAELSEGRGIPCINRFFNAETAALILERHGKAKVIHGSGIFFHLEELHSVFEGIQTLLKPDGMVIAEFIYLPEMVRHGAYDQVYHEHLLYYTLDSFDDVLRRHGLTIADAELVPIHGGSCIACITHAATARRTPALVELIAAERREGFGAIAVYQDFARRAAASRDRLVGLLRDLRAAGKTIHALGAPVKGTTILNYGGIDRELVDCAVEINDLKCGTWYPGTRIPVDHQARVPPPDVYLLLAWNFQDEILEKLADFRRAGGQVLIPIPEPRLI